MSVIVKGMEMPNACCHCPCSDSAGCAVTGRAMTTEEMAGQLGDIDDCPIRPLPEKHGRLIDADAMKRVWMGARIDGDIGMLLDARPTIVEAEGDIGVKPVVRGQWIWRHRHRGGFRRVTGEDDFGVRHTITVDERYQIDDPYCPFCGKLNESVFLNYCPNCGADMRDDKP